MRVLIVDDDVNICHMISHILRTEGYDPEAVHSGEEAMEVMSTPAPPALVLLDLGLPGMSGLDVCRALRGEGGGVYVFILSGRQSEEEVLAGFEAGADDFIAKPFDPAILVARLRAAERRIRGDGGKGSISLAQGLRELSERSTGELVVRGAERTGYIVVHRGKIAWIHVSGRASLLSVLVRLGVNEVELRAALEDCRLSRAPFLDTLLAWGLVTRERLEHALRKEFSARLSELGGWPGSRVFFAPKSVPLESSILFDLSDLEAAPSSSPASLRGGLSPLRPREIPAALEQLADELAGSIGVQSVALFDSTSGQVLLTRGQPCDTGLPRRIVRALRAAQGERLEESLVSSDSHFHLIGRLGIFDVYVVAVRSLSPNVGLMRMRMSQLRNTRAHEPDVG